MLPLPLLQVASQLLERLFAGGCVLCCGCMGQPPCTGGPPCITVTAHPMPIPLRSACTPARRQQHPYWHTFSGTTPAARAAPTTTPPAWLQAAWRARRTRWSARSWAMRRHKWPGCWIGMAKIGGQVGMAGIEGGTLTRCSDWCVSARPMDLNSRCWLSGLLRHGAGCPGGAGTCRWVQVAIGGTRERVKDTDADAVERGVMRRPVRARGRTTLLAQVRLVTHCSRGA